LNDDVFKIPYSRRGVDVLLDLFENLLLCCSVRNDAAAVEGLSLPLNRRARYSGACFD
jgi:hypothetical protein